MTDAVIPTFLSNYTSSALYIHPGGIEENIPIVKCPKKGEIDGAEEEEGILKAFNGWWATTPAARSGTVKPRWNSAARTGSVWNHFREVAHLRTGRPYVYCLNCGNLLTHPSAGSKGDIGTKHLLNHLRSQACLRSNSLHEGLPLPELQRNANQETGALSYSQQVYERELVQVVLDNNWSFRTVERPSFQRFIRVLRPDAVITTRYKFTEMIQEQFKNTKNSLLEDVGKETRISIALDAWSASNHLSFLAIKSYYIAADWELKETLLDFIPMRGSHTGVSMATEVVAVLKATNKIRQLLAVTCDNAANNGTLTRSLEQKLRDDRIRWSSKENTIPCLAHIINLVVQDIIQALKISSPLGDEQIKNLQQRHVGDIEAAISVPNSLRKGCTVLSHKFITYLRLRRFVPSALQLTSPLNDLSALLQHNTIYQPGSDCMLFGMLRLDGIQPTTCAKEPSNSRSTLMSGLSRSLH